MDKNKEQENLEKVHSIARENSAPVQRLFASPDGQEVLAILKRAYDHADIFDADPYKTAYKLGCRDVVVYLEQMNRYEGPKDG